jgi:hypothetical protein
VVIKTDANSATCFVLEVASAEASWAPLFDASVIFTSAPNLLRASVMGTEGSLLIPLGAAVCPTDAVESDRVVLL